MKTAGQLYRFGVVTVHGIRTTGKWQKDLHPILQDNLIFALDVDYGYSRPTWNARSVSERAAHEFGNQCRVIEDRGLGVNAVGHSFGSLVIGRALDMKPELKLKRLILSSSILPCSFEWSRFGAQKRIKRVLNEFCPSDLVVPLSLLYRSLLLPTGRSGTKGFADRGEDVVHNVSYRAVGHTLLPAFDHMKKAWLPFLSKGTVPKGN
jgi:pimeloyl-ACP methyl ester carboxylesterase